MKFVDLILITIIVLCFIGVVFFAISSFNKQQEYSELGKDKCNFEYIDHSKKADIIMYPYGECFYNDDGLIIPLSYNPRLGEWTQ
jgi:hypothetical protein